RVVVGLDSGFAAYQLADPLLVADITGNGVLNATDATRILQTVLGLTQPLIPPLPASPPTIVPGGPDPLLHFPRRLLVRPGATIPVLLLCRPSDGLESADLVIAYDPSRLELVDVPRGSLTADFDVFAANAETPGIIRAALGRSAGPIAQRGN